jgi:hypothetical protein
MRLVVAAGTGVPPRYQRSKDAPDGDGPSKDWDPEVSAADPL